MKIRPVEAEFFTFGRKEGRKDGQADMTKLIVAEFNICGSEHHAL